MTEERGIIPKSLLEKIIAGIMVFWVLFPAICIIGINTDVLLHPLLVDLTQYLGYILLLLSFLIFIKNNGKIEIKRDLPYLFLLAMLGWIFVSAIFSPNRQIAFWGAETRREGALMFLAYAGFFCGALSLSKDKYKKIIFNTFLGVAVFQAVCCFLQFFGFKVITVGYIINGYFAEGGWPWTGIYNNPNHFGYYLSMSIVYAGYSFVLNKSKTKWMYLLSYMILVATLIFNNTLGCFIAVVATLIIGKILLFIKDKTTLSKNILLIVLLIVVTTTVTLTANEGIISSLIQTGTEISDIAQGEINSDAGSGRMELWLGALQFIGERPLVGYGPDNLTKRYTEIGVDLDKTHNEYLQYMAECGIPTLIFYITALALLYIRRIKILKSLSKVQLIFMAVVGVYLISAFFGNTMIYIVPHFWMALALI